MTFPNFYEHPLAYNRVRIGGRLVKAVLKAVDGIKIEYEWSEQKPTGTSGASWIYKGAKPAGPHKLTFLCGDGPQYTAAECYDDLRDLYERFAPTPNVGGATTSTSGTANAFTIGPTKDASSAPAAGGGGVITIPDTTTTASAATSGKSGSNPGPRPPTLTIQNGFINYHGTTAISLKSWDGPKPTDTNGIEVEIEIIPQKEPVPAGTGIAPAKSADQFTIGPTKDQPSGSGSAAADKDASQAGAGT